MMKKIGRGLANTTSTKPVGIDGRTVRPSSQYTVKSSDQWHVCRQGASGSNGECGNEGTDVFHCFHFKRANHAGTNRKSVSRYLFVPNVFLVMIMGIPVLY